MKNKHWREEALLRTPDKLDDAIEESRAHGDLDIAAARTGLDARHLKLLALYEGGDPATAEASLALQLAQAEGKANQKGYAKRVFLAALGRHASIPEAVASQRWYSRSFFEEERTRDPAFDAAWAETVEGAIDKLRLEAWRRGAEGVDEPVTYQGEFCYQRNPLTGESEQVTVRKYSDGLLTTLLKRYDPAFRERTGVDLTASIDGGLTQDAAAKALGQLSPEELEVLTRLVEGADGPEQD